MSAAAIAIPREPKLADEPEIKPGVNVSALKRFTVDEYHAMITAGVFAEDENFELLEGWIVRKMTKHPPYWICMELVRKALTGLQNPEYFIHSQNPVTTRDSEPEPDLSLVRGEPRNYLGGNPDPKKAPLVIEVANSSFSKDRGIKKRVYARARISVYWLVNLPKSQVEIYTEPSRPTAKPDYRKCEIAEPEDVLPIVIDGHEIGQIKVKDILP